MYGLYYNNSNISLVDDDNNTQKKVIRVRPLLLGTINGTRNPTLTVYKGNPYSVLEPLSSFRPPPRPLPVRRRPSPVV